MPAAASISSVSAGALKDVPLTRAHSVTLENGDLVWTTQGKPSAEPDGRMPEASVVLVLEHPAEAGYLVYSVTDPADRGGDFQLSALHALALPGNVLDVHALRRGPPPQLLRRLHVVVSTRSGTCQAEKFWAQVLRPLLAALGIAEQAGPGNDDEDGAGYELTITQSASTVTEVARRLQRTEDARPRTIVLLSGDGGVADLLNGSADGAGGGSKGPRPAIALLPLGTGNALFHSLHRPRYVAAAAAGTAAPSPLVLALRTLFRGTAAPLPTFEASFSPGARLASAPGEEVPEKAPAVERLVGAIVASYGFHASLVWESDTASYRAHGDARFGMAAAELLKLAHAYRADVDVLPAGRAVAATGGSTHAYVLAALASNLERRFVVSPESRPLDGRVRLVRFGEADAERTMAIMGAAYEDGKHVGMRWTWRDGTEEAVEYDEVDEVRVTVREEDARWRKVCVDGTIVELEEGGWMLVRRSLETEFDVVVDEDILQ